MKKYPGSVGSRAPIAEAALNIYGEIAPGILTKELGLEPTYTGTAVGGFPPEGLFVPILRMLPMHCWGAWHPDTMR